MFFLVGFILEWCDIRHSLSMFAVPTLAFEWSLITFLIRERATIPDAFCVWVGVGGCDVLPRLPHWGDPACRPNPGVTLPTLRVPLSRQLVCWQWR